ncbi:MAG TPA: acetyl-CoA carboxylase biotin carboxyl carrier protein subunit [Bacteroidia bacterium]|nr:acetyl-CoA carboxylase biotin carboxyl carrier protein subunit [Bacteroidia bacterium]
MIKANINNQSFDIIFEDKSFKKGTINSQMFELDRTKSTSNSWHILREGKSFNIEILKIDRVAKQVDLKLNGKRNSVKLSDQFDALLKSLGMDSMASKKVLELKAPMPGLVLNIAVGEGDTIAKGDALIVLEAMKMENIIKSPTDGIIKKIHAVKGNAVEKNQILISFQ